MVRFLHYKSAVKQKKRKDELDLYKELRKKILKENNELKNGLLEKDKYIRQKLKILKEIFNIDS